MTIQQCRYVLEIARFGSFSRAAKHLFIAQSSISISIKSLESELGIKIFNRAANGVYLTDEGAEFVRYASKIVETDDFILERYSSPKEMKKLYIDTQHYDFIADIFGKFISENGDERYKFSIKEIETYNVIGEVETARCDIGIIAIKDGDFDLMKRYLTNKNILFTPLLRCAPHVFMRREHPLSACEKLTLPELNSFPYVSYEQGEHNSAFFTEEMIDGAAVDKHIEISDRATLMNLLLISDAYTIGTGIMPSALNSGDIVSIPLESDEHYIIGYLKNEERKLSDTAEKFIEYLSNAIKIIK
ncbi:MAG: LysR family transcriptional regulator [Clostridia bacterium]|nr:LysR family transcriptional regulator [Clostridia bacterium]